MMTMTPRTIQPVDMTDNSCGTKRQGNEQGT